MAQHDQVIDNAPGLAVRTDINAALAALFSSSSGTVEPTVKAGGQMWLDTAPATPLLKIRNSANTAWIVLAQLATTDIGFGKRATPNRYVWNDNDDLTGKDVMTLEMTGAYLAIPSALNMQDTAASNVVRGQIAAAIGAATPVLNGSVYDSAQALVNRWSLDASGFRFTNGDLLWWNTSNILRGAVRSNHGTQAAKVTMEAYDTAGAMSAWAEINSAGLYGFSAGAAIRFGGTSGVVRGLILADPAANNANSLVEMRAIDTAAATVNSLFLDANGVRFTNGDLLWWNASNVLRGAVRSNHGSQAASIKMEAYDTIGAISGYAEVTNLHFGAWPSTGLFKLGGNTGVMRAAVNCDPAATSANSYVELRACDTAQATVNALFVDSVGARLNSGDFYANVSGVARAKYGGNGSDGATIKYFSAAAVLINTLAVGPLGSTLISPDGSTAAFRATQANGNVRFSYTGNSDTTGAALAVINVYDSTGTRKQRLEIDDALGISVMDGANAGQVLTTGNYPARNTGSAATDFIVGTYLLFNCPAGSPVSRNGAVTMRLNTTDATGYQHTGAGSLLTGTWLSCGLVVGSSPLVGMARRTA